MRTKRELLYAWLLATLLERHSFDPLRAADRRRSVGSDAGGRGHAFAVQKSSLIKLLLAATLVHASVSLFWSVVLWLALPRRRTMLWALLASAAIALIDLRLIAPAFFPEVAALAFWPQFADHLMWGACYSVGLSLGRPRATRP